MLYFTFIKTTRLGNWLFQYAAAMSISNEIAGFVSDTSLDSLISSYHELFGDRIPLVHELPPDTIIYHEKGAHYSPLPSYLKDTGNICLYGYFQSEKYFQVEKIRSAFAMSPERREYLMGRYGGWLMRPNITGISVRRKDYLELASKYTPCTMEYYRKCMARLPECDDFIVCSDDIAWCKDSFPQVFPDKRFLFIESEPALNQLYIQSLCKNNIIPNSTFSWWGAWLNMNPSKRVFMPSQWYGLRYRLEGLDDRDIYFRGVIKIDNSYTPFEWIKALCDFLWNWFKRTFYPVKYFVVSRIKFRQ